MYYFHGCKHNPSCRAQPAGCSGRRMQELPHQHEHRGRDAHNRQRRRHADALGHVPQLRHRARVHLPSSSRQRGFGAFRREAACIQHCRWGRTYCMCFSRSMQCGTHAIVQSFRFRTLSKDVNMADTSLVMEMTTCRVPNDVLHIGCSVHPCAVAGSGKHQDRPSSCTYL